MSVSTNRVKKNLCRNALGAFADCAVLFPLLVLLGAKGLYSPVVLLISSGVLYILAGAYFGIPMPIQPLKSIVVGALAFGASSIEIRWCAGLLGFFLLLLVASRKEVLLGLVPARLVHQVQVGLGALLLVQSYRCLAASALPIFGLCAMLGLLILFLSDWKGIPWMGVFAAVGMVYALWMSLHPVATVAPLAQGSSPLRIALIVSLVLPQIALTLANSVVGTQAAAEVYFKEKAAPATYRALCTSIGAGNILMALIGGLPFCHGSGGLTAHVRGGSTNALSNYLIGGFLLLLAMISWHGGAGTLVVPAVFVGTLLFVTGIQHMTLARSTAATGLGKLSLAMAFLLAFFTQNLLWVLAAALALEGLRKFLELPRLQLGEK